MIVFHAENIELKGIGKVKESNPVPYKMALDAANGVETTAASLSAAFNKPATPSKDVADENEDEEEDEDDEEEIIRKQLEANKKVEEALLASLQRAKKEREGKRDSGFTDASSATTTATTGTASTATGNGSKYVNTEGSKAPPSAASQEGSKYNPQHRDINNNTASTASPSLSTADIDMKMKKEGEKKGSAAPPPSGKIVSSKESASSKKPIAKVPSSDEEEDEDDEDEDEDDDEEEEEEEDEDEEDENRKRAVPMVQQSQCGAGKCVVM